MICTTRSVLLTIVFVVGALLTLCFFIPACIMLSSYGNENKAVTLLIIAFFCLGVMTVLTVGIAFGAIP